jgi:hypothetical protein
VSARLLLLACLAAPSLPSGTGAQGAPPLERADLARWRELLVPTGDELAFETIDWIPSFADGVLRADAEGRALLLWAMNGHPLGCT